MAKVKKDLTKEEEKINSNIYERITLLVKNKHTYISEICDDRTFYEWTKLKDNNYNYSGAKISNLIKYADIFECSLDYLCKLSDNPKSNSINESKSYNIQAISNKLSLSTESLEKIINDTDISLILNDLLSNSYGIFLLKSLKGFLSIAPYGFSFDESYLNIKPIRSEDNYKNNLMNQIGSLDSFSKNQIINLMDAYKKDSDYFNTKTIANLLKVLDNRINKSNEYINNINKTIKDKANKILKSSNGDIEEAIHFLYSPSLLKENNISIKDNEIEELRKYFDSHLSIKNDSKEKKDLIKMYDNYKDKKTKNKPLFYI